MIFLVSDLHAYHANILEYCPRPWKTMEEMNQGLIDRWNSVVSNNDTVYLLGDVAFAGTQKIEIFLKQLNRKTLILVRGNHDAKISDKHWLEIGVDEVYEQLYLPDYKLLLCHFPYITGQESEDTRYLHMRPIDTGLSLAHGHLHSAPESKIRLTSRGSLMYDVGVDGNGFCPVNINSVLNECNNFVSCNTVSPRVVSTTSEK